MPVGRIERDRDGREHRWSGAPPAGPKSGPGEPIEAVENVNRDGSRRGLSERFIHHSARPTHNRIPPSEGAPDSRNSVGGLQRDF